MARKAAELPSAQNAFRQKHLDEWTEQAERWIPMDLWDEGAEPLIDLADIVPRVLRRASSSSGRGATPVNLAYSHSISWTRQKL